MGKNCKCWRETAKEREKVKKVKAENFPEEAGGDGLCRHPGQGGEKVSKGREKAVLMTLQGKGIRLPVLDEAALQINQKSHRRPHPAKGVILYVKTSMISKGSSYRNCIKHTQNRRKCRSWARKASLPTMWFCLNIFKINKYSTFANSVFKLFFLLSFIFSILFTTT